jgi:hypothetical protein
MMVLTPLITLTPRKIRVLEPDSDGPYWRGDYAWGFDVRFKGRLIQRAGDYVTARTKAQLLKFAEESGWTTDDKAEIIE